MSHSRTIGSVYDSDFVMRLGLATSFCREHICTLFVPQPSSNEEKGLHERAARGGLSLPCPITWAKVPVQEEGYPMRIADWPCLLPHDFASSLASYIFGGTCGFQKMLIRLEVATMISEGYLWALLDDQDKLGQHWGKLLFPWAPCCQQP